MNDELEYQSMEADAGEQTLEQQEQQAEALLPQYVTAEQMEAFGNNMVSAIRDSLRPATANDDGDADDPDPDVFEAGWSKKLEAKAEAMAKKQVSEAMSGLMPMLQKALIPGIREDMAADMAKGEPAHVQANLKTALAGMDADALAAIKGNPAIQSAMLTMAKSAPAPSVPNTVGSYGGGETGGISEDTIRAIYNQTSADAQKIVPFKKFKEIYEQKAKAGGY